MDRPEFERSVTSDPGGSSAEFASIAEARKPSAAMLAFGAVGTSACFALAIWYLMSKGYSLGTAATMIGVVLGLGTIPLGGIGFAVLIIVGLCVLLGPLGIVAAVVALAAIALIRRGR